MRISSLGFVALVALTASLCADPIPSIGLVDLRKLPGWKGDPVGNVVITTPKGQQRQLTTTGAAQQPQSAYWNGGLVGWVDCSKEGDPGALHVMKGVPIGSRIILHMPDGSLLTIASGKPIIEQWGFDPDGIHVVLKSRALHGPAVIERFAIKDGSKAGISPAYGPNAPPWAKPYLDR